MTKKSILALIILSLSLFACSGEQNEAASDLVKTAQAVIDELSQGEYASVVGRFDSTMTTNVSEAQLEQIWTSLTTQCGPYQNQAETKTVTMDNYQVIYIKLVFSDIPYWGTVIFDEQSLIAGLRFISELPPDEPVLADYIKPNSFVERGGVFGATDWPLEAVISIPNGPGPFPAVILVHRHGPNDKNETIASNYPFMDIAQGLASKGVAVLRYDNRAFTYGAKLDSVENITVQQEIIRDIHFAVILLKSSPEIDPSQIYMLGHGFGGYLAPMVAEQTDSIAGYILLGAPTRPLEQVIAQEVEYFLSEDGSISSSEQNTLDQLKAEAEMVTNPELTKEVPGEFLPLGRPGSYWLQLRDYNPVDKAIEKMTEPMLILQGGRDYHATMADFEDWRQILLARNNVILKSFPKLNHLFMRGEGRSNPKEFLKHGNVDGEVIDVIATWVKGKK